MGERKVINKYYPHDFDPSKVPRRRRPKNEQTKVRTMLPMTVRCGACGEYLGRGTKFSARMEDVPGERYLGAIRVFRFYIKCSRCSAEIAFKTDPGNSGYALESGASATRDDATTAREEEEKERRRDGLGDAMAALERRARDGRREMDADAVLEEARSLNARRARVAPSRPCCAAAAARPRQCRNRSRTWTRRSSDPSVSATLLDTSTGSRTTMTGRRRRMSSRSLCPKPCPTTKRIRIRTRSGGGRLPWLLFPRGDACRRYQRASPTTAVTPTSRRVKHPPGTRRRIVALFRC